MSDNGSKIKNDKRSNNFTTAHSTKHFHFLEQGEPPSDPKGINHSNIEHKKNGQMFSRGR